MRIAIVGYGRMGKLIAELAENRGHTISFRIHSGNKDDINKISPKNTDVAVEFTHPEAAFQNIITLLNNKVKVVSGTTGWLDNYERAKDICIKNKTAFLYASNFSIGVNVLFAVNRYLAEKMKFFDNYGIQIREIHHTGKIDAPSGTAIALELGIKAVLGAENYKNRSKPIVSERIDPCPGTHEINYTSKIDRISLVHEAFNRDGFVLGALVAAEWLTDKIGVYNMSDVLIMDTGCSKVQL